MNITMNPKIIIIGAGAAGYAAACKLLENGFNNITILEAENRIGGRINSVFFGDAFVDLGAQWCHGETNNIVYEMVKDLDLIQKSICNYKEFIFVDSGGDFIDSNVSNKLIELLFQLTYDNDTLKLQNGSFGEYIIKTYDEKISKDYPEINRLIAKQIMDWFHKLTNNLNASTNWFDISANGLSHYQDCEGDLILNWKDKGYKTIFSILKKEIPNPSKRLDVDEKILFNKEVTKITWDDYKKKKLRHLIVECADGSSYKAEHVIFTASLGVLKELHKSLFVPELPSYKKNAIRGLSIGCVNKVFLKFPKKWWPDDFSGFDFVWKDEHLVNIISEFPDGPIKDGKSWLEGIFGFHPIDCNPNVLLVFLNGMSVADSELLTDDVIMNGCMYLLKKFVGKHFDIPPPNEILRSYWASNKHFRGSYTYRSIETDRLNTSAEDLAHPLGNNALLFAGEATHSHFYSTVHGAIESGFREAHRIISHYSATSNRSKLKCKVAIVGAGIAGLAAALQLVQTGCTDILLVEAQDQAGGRIRSEQVAGGYVDLGAQWLHGDNNALWKISTSNHLLSNTTIYEGRGVFLREDGYKFDDYLVEKVAFTIGQILEECEKFAHSSNNMNIPGSVGKYLEEKFGEYLKRNSLSNEDIRLYLELYDWNVRFQVIDNCCDNLYNVSAKFWGRYFCPTSDGQAHINYARGHSSVVDVLLGKLPEGCLLTNHPVLNIDWSTNENKSIQIKCENATIIETDAVIVTCSLGVLKKHASTLFTPLLPNEMTEIIDGMGFAGICKIFLLFQEKWWNAEEGFQLIFNYNNKYGDDWTRYLSGFDPVLDQPNMLLGWVGGKGAELVENISEEQIGKQCAELLKKFTGNKNITNPVRVIRSCWSTNPWVLGGYSHTTPKCDDCVLLPERLQKPLRDEKGTIRVLLAGEHTHPEHFSTTHGAFESGITQAQTLLNDIVSTNTQKRNEIAMLKKLSI